MTRARAAAKSAATDEITNTKTIKPSAAKAKLSTAATTSRRKAPAPEPQDVVMEDDAPVKKTKKRGTTKVVKALEENNEVGRDTRAAGTRGSVRGRKTPVMEERDDVEMTDVEVPKARGRPRATVAATKKGTDGEVLSKTTRGRAKVAVTVPMPAEDGITVERPTRARGTATAPTASTRSRAATTAVSKAPPKKKVTFQDMPEQDNKENMPLVTDTKDKKPAATGLKAKPVRKPASTRGRKPATRSRIDSAVQDNDESKPLSPKKVTQVAKSNSSVSSDDELCGAKTPIKPLSKSPVKASMDMLGSIRNSGAARKLDFKPEIAPSSPSKSVAPASSVLTASPARRLPLSPFRDAMKGSPRRGMVLPELIAPPSFKLSASPLKASLLQSPARRPASPQKLVASWASPLKSAPVAFESPKKVEAVANLFDESTVVLSNVSFDKPDTMITTHFRSSPERSVKVHKMTDQELAEGSSSPTKIGRAMEGVVMTSSQLSQEEQEPTVVAEQRDAEETIVDRPSAIQVLTTSSPKSQTTDDLLTEDIGSATSVRSTIPSNSPLVGTTQFTSSSAWKQRDDGEESEDELQSDCTPLSQFNLSSKTRLSTSSTPFRNTKLNRGTFNLDTPATALAQPSQGIGMTPLAVQLSGWLASSPEKNRQPNVSRGIFTPATAVAPKVRAISRLSTGSMLKETPPKSTFFEDEMAVRDLGEEVDDLSVDEGDAMVLVQETLPSEDEEPANTQVSQASEASEVYGDENEPVQLDTAPIDPLLLIPHQEQVRVTYATPRRPAQSALRVVHTVSKVPLKPAADVSPIKVPKKRSRSLSGASSPRKGPPSPGIARSISASSISQEAKEPLASTEDGCDDTESDRPELTFTSAYLNTDSAPAAESPAKTPGRNSVSQVLQGAVVYVDVHTTEGADASGIFVDLLTQMGARCVRHWNWNPRASSSLPRDAAFDYDAAIEEAREASTPGGKIGITHVVFKDGGKRTLEKVRDSKGVVLCVGVGWVLE
jgi:hypothetical protein